MPSDDESGSSEFPLIILFGVLSAFVLLVVFVNIYGQQVNARIAEEAEGLVDEISRTAFLSYSSQTVGSVSLPSSIGGDQYVVRIVENSVFVVKLLSGPLGGEEYVVVSTVELFPESPEFQPGSTLYFWENGDRIQIGSAPPENLSREVTSQASSTPPPFYDFAKGHPVEAAGIAEAFFSLRENHEDIDVTGYRWENEFLFLYVENLGWVKLGVSENTSPVEEIENVSLVDWMGFASPENTENEGVPSIENAWLSGWFYSPSQVLEHLSSRTWKNENGDIVSIPAGAQIAPVAVTTRVSTYPAWRVEFPSVEIYYRAMPWWEEENTPGFLFQSYPPLEPII